MFVKERLHTKKSVKGAVNVKRLENIALKQVVEKILEIVSLWFMSLF